MTAQQHEAALLEAMHTGDYTHPIPDACTDCQATPAPGSHPRCDLCLRPVCDRCAVQIAGAVRCRGCASRQGGDQ